jgi:hypothetical protein
MDANNFLHLGIDATGKLAATIKAVDATGDGAHRDRDERRVGRERRHAYGALRCVLNDGTGQATVSVVTDGTVVTAAAIAWPTLRRFTFFPAYTTIYVGGPAVSTVGGVFTGTLAHVGVYVQTDNRDHRRAPAGALECRPDGLLGRDRTGAHRPVCVLSRYPDRGAVPRDRAAPRRSARRHDGRIGGRPDAARSRSPPRTGCCSTAATGR